VRCQAVRGVTWYFLSISRAATPFLLATISKSTKTQVRIGTLVPWRTVLVVTENCFRQVRHFHRRRSV